MSFNPLKPDLVEAAKDALKSLLSAELTSLNTALTRDSLWNLPQITASMLFIGDFETVPTLERAPIWITIFGGEEMVSSGQSNLDITGGYGYRNNIELTIRAYLHPEAFSIEAIGLQAEQRERALDRVVGWLRAGVCNTHDNKTLLLESDEYGTGADELNETHITRVIRDNFYKSFGKMLYVRGVEATWTGYIE